MNSLRLYKIIIVYIEATISSSNTPKELFIFLSIILAGKILVISKNLKITKIRIRVKRLFDMKTTS